jgi:hypothetical protein
LPTSCCVNIMVLYFKGTREWALRKKKQPCEMPLRQPQLMNKTRATKKWPFLFNPMKSVEKRPKEVNIKEKMSIILLTFLLGSCLFEGVVKILRNTILSFCPFSKMDKNLGTCFAKSVFSLDNLQKQIN